MTAATNKIIDPWEDGKILAQVILRQPLTHSVFQFLSDWLVPGKLIQTTSHRRLTKKALSVRPPDVVLGVHYPNQPVPLRSSGVPQLTSCWSVSMRPLGLNNVAIAASTLGPLQRLGGRQPIRRLLAQHPVFLQLQ